MIVKRILRPERVRVPPGTGFSWVDRRFLKEQASHLSGDAILLYFFLAAVSDRHGLSYFKDQSAGARIKMSVAQVIRAREELLARDLVEYQPPLTQVLSLPDLPKRPKALRAQCTKPSSVGDILAEIMSRRSHRE
jgi:hypothetical protein